MDQNVILNKIRKSIHDKDPAAKAVLFGSRARGDNRADSDWDVLILIENDSVTNEIEDSFRDDLYRIELESGQIISAFIYSKKFWETKLRFSPLYKSVAREGVSL